jgi:hypothetical protein
MKRKCDIRASLGGGQRNGLSQPLGRASDKNSFVFEVAHAGIVPGTHLSPAMAAQKPKTLPGTSTDNTDQDIPK